MAHALDHILQLFGWSEAVLLDFAHSVKSSTKKANFPYLQVKQYMGRVVCKSHMVDFGVAVLTFSPVCSSLVRPRRRNRRHDEERVAGQEHSLPAAVERRENVRASEGMDR